MTDAPTPSEPPGFSVSRHLSDQVVEEAAIVEIQKALALREPVRVPAGSLILREGEPVTGIFLRLRGEIQLLRTIDGEETVFHARTAGRVIGLMSLADGDRAFFTCRAQTDVEFLHLTFAELDEGLRNHPEISPHFVTLLLRSMARRNQRAIELQIDINRLNQDLKVERDELARTLRRLKEAQTRLVESEKMATLGQLVAGIGHEMNNPVSAILRSAGFIQEDLLALAGDLPDRATFLFFLEGALQAPAYSTRELREAARRLEAEISDADIATRLTRMGILELGQLPPGFSGIGLKELRTQLPAWERYAQLGASLRNIRSCSQRLARLVTGLRSYSRASRQWEENVDVQEELEETLLIFGHALRQVSVEKTYEPCPPITCRPGEINQVWTNLLSNAIEAMDGQGTLQLDIRPQDNGVLVTVVDSGRGILPEHLERIFELHFTTRAGRVDFGLGLGLAICKDIVDRHGGRIQVASQPGKTSFMVWLPQTPPDLRPDVEPEEHAG